GGVIAAPQFWEGVPLRAAPVPSDAQLGADFPGVPSTRVAVWRRCLRQLTLFHGREVLRVEDVVGSYIALEAHGDLEGFDGSGEALRIDATKAVFNDVRRLDIHVVRHGEASGFGVDVERFVARQNGSSASGRVGHCISKTL